jgi:hypothetical protein
MSMTEHNSAQSIPPEATAAADEAASPDFYSKKSIPPAAQRALAEAQARRVEIDRLVSERPKELRGRSGPEPIRYGDWEIKGLASDF